MVGERKKINSTFGIGFNKTTSDKKRIHTAQIYGKLFSFVRPLFKPKRITLV